MLYMTIVNELSDVASITVRHPQSGPGGAGYEPRIFITSLTSMLPSQTIDLSLMCHESTHVAFTSSLLFSQPSNIKPACGLPSSDQVYSIVTNLPIATSSTIALDSDSVSGGFNQGRYRRLVPAQWPINFSRL